MLGRLRLCAGTVGLVLVASGLVVASPAPAAPAIGGVGSAAAIPDKYIVTLKSTPSVRGSGAAARAVQLAERHHGHVGSVWSRGMLGFTVSMSQAQAQQLATEPDVAKVTQDQWVKAPPRRTSPIVRPRAAGVAPAATQTPPAWGLDRIDQHNLPLDNHYAYDDAAGQGVHVYVIGTGIQAANPDLAGRVSYGPNFVSTEPRPNSEDCNGAGTEAAGTIAGTQYGVAKKANLVAVRVYGCNGLADPAWIIDAIEWVTANAARPAVLDFNFADDCVDPNNPDVVLPCDPGLLQQIIVAQEAAYQAGVAVVANAGDTGRDTCTRAVGAAPHTFYVGATSNDDMRAAFSDFGSCLTMFAPGDGIATDSMAGPTVASGTEIAAAYVAGAVALFMSKPEFAGASPGQIRTELVTNRSTNGVITGLDAASPNRLLFTGPQGFFTIGDPLSMSVAGDGPLGLIGADRSGRLVRRQQGSHGGWTGGVVSVTKGWLSVGTGVNADGRVELVGLTPAGEVWRRAQTAPGAETWYSWSQLTGPPGNLPVVRAVLAHNASNRLELFASTTSGQVFYRSQSAPGARTWGGWAQLSASTKLRSIAAVTDTDQRIRVLGVDDAGQVWQNGQTSSTDNNWTGFTKLSGFGMASICVTRNHNGTMELIGVDSGGGVWHRTQSDLHVDTWTGWSPLPTKTMSAAGAGLTPGGRVQVVGVDNLGNLWQSTQTGVDAGTYGPWTRVDGQLRP